jgi:hypothetical protein
MIFSISLYGNCHSSDRSKIVFPARNPLKTVRWKEGGSRSKVRVIGASTWSVNAPTATPMPKDVFTPMPSRFALSGSSMLLQIASAGGESGGARQPTGKKEPSKGLGCYGSFAAPRCSGVAVAQTCLHSRAELVSVLLASAPAPRRMPARGNAETEHGREWGVRPWIPENAKLVFFIRNSAGGPKGSRRRRAGGDGDSRCNSPAPGVCLAWANLRTANTTDRRPLWQK